MGRKVVDIRLANRGISED